MWRYFEWVCPLRTKSHSWWNSLSQIFSRIYPKLSNVWSACDRLGWRCWEQGFTHGSPQWKSRQSFLWRVREGGIIHSYTQVKERWMAVERLLTDMKNLFLKIKFLNHYATAVVLLLDRATHTDTHKMIPWSRATGREQGQLESQYSSEHEKSVKRTQKEIILVRPSFLSSFIPSFLHSIHPSFLPSGVIDRWDFVQASYEVPDLSFPLCKY